MKYKSYDEKDKNTNKNKYIYIYMNRQITEKETQKATIANNWRNPSQNKMPLFAHHISKKVR